MKRTVCIFLVLLAGLAMLAHAVLPHHHNCKGCAAMARVMAETAVPESAGTGAETKLPPAHEQVEDSDCHGSGRHGQHPSHHAECNVSDAFEAPVRLGGDPQRQGLRPNADTFHPHSSWAAVLTATTGIPHDCGIAIYIPLFQSKPLSGNPHCHTPLRAPPAV